jgi:Domain of unknown function (DUF5615)
MRTLSSQLAARVGLATQVPRVYADANLPAGLVAFMRATLGWDVFFVMEHDDLRRAPDIAHFRLARQLRRTLITMDRDYLDDRAFPPLETSGVLVLWAPNQRGLERLLARADREMFRPNDGTLIPLPLDQTKRQVFPEFGAELG